MNRRTRILIVEDDPAMAMALEMRLGEWGFETEVANDGGQAGRLAESNSFELILSDVVLPGMSGLELLRALKAGHPLRPVVLMTAQGTVDMAVEAMKQGAQDFLTKPLDIAKLKAVLESVQEEMALRKESQELDSQLEKGSGFGPFVGTSKKIKEVYALLKNVASSDVSAILTGESGTGKELAARAIHEQGSRVNGPFIAVNAAAIPETLVESEVFGHEKGAFTGAVSSRAGCFELADQGTLFLDEISEMPMLLQPKLLRVLEGGKVRRVGGRDEIPFDVRLIAATNRDPKTAVSEGKLREDLYYRLNVFTVTIPPLRERREDIPPLAQHFVRLFNGRHGTAIQALRPEVWEKLKSYSWPGNVRELKNVIERAVIVTKGDWIELSALPPYLRQPGETPQERMVLPLGLSMADTEKELILRTLEQTRNNKAEAARRLGLDVKTIRNKLKAYGL